MIQQSSRRPNVNWIDAPSDCWNARCSRVRFHGKMSINAIDLPLPTLRDDYFYVQPSADILLTRYWSFGGYYLRRQNSGSVSTVDFYSNEAGVRTTIKF